jgi:hypothetical protein
VKDFPAYISWISRLDTQGNASQSSEFNKAHDALPSVGFRWVWLTKNKLVAVQILSSDSHFGSAGYLGEGLFQLPSNIPPLGTKIRGQRPALDSDHYPCTLCSWRGLRPLLLHFWARTCRVDWPGFYICNTGATGHLQGLISYNGLDCSVIASSGPNFKVVIDLNEGVYCK